MDRSVPAEPKIGNASGETTVDTEIMDMGRAHPSVQIKSGNLEMESKWVNQMEEPKKGLISEVHSQEKWGSVVGGRSRKERKEEETQLTLIHGSTLSGTILSTRSKKHTISQQHPGTCLE